MDRADGNGVRSGLPADDRTGNGQAGEGDWAPARKEAARLTFAASAATARGASWVRWQRRIGRSISQRSGLRERCRTERAYSSWAVNPVGALGAGGSGGGVPVGTANPSKTWCA